MADNSAFISYRRVPGYPWARLIWEDLGERDVDVFLDLESMRAAGRFDDRLLNQIASRPYFIVVLTEETLERCAGTDDWMRREIEHAIDTDRIIVPTFIAPFEPSEFPPDLPPHIEEALSQSQGLTVYSQYLSAAIDKLADDLLTPVEMESIGLTEEDARFESQAIREIRSLPPPPLPVTPIAESASAEPDVIETVAPGAAPIEAVAPETTAADSTPTDTPEAPTEPPHTTSTDTPEAPTGTEPVAAEDDVDISPTAAAAIVPAPLPSDDPVRSNPTGPVADETATPPTAAAAIVPAPPMSDDPVRSNPPDPAADDSSEPPAARASTFTGDSKGPNGRRRWLVGGVVAAALVAIVAVVVVLSQRGSETRTVLEAGTWLEPGDSVRSPDGAHELVMTSSGQLQLQTGGAVVWEPNYPPTPTASAVVQSSDGNFVVYRSPDPDSGALWASGTSSVGPGGTLHVIDESGTGYVVIEDSDANVRWREPAAVAPPDDPPDTAAPDDTASQELRSIIESDRPFVEAALDAWVVQLSAKHVGLVEDDGVPWTDERILGEYDALVGQFDVNLVSGADYNLNRAHRLDASRTDFEEWFFFLVLDDVEPFESRDAAIGWCRQNRPGDCGVKLLSADPLTDSQSWFSQPASE